MKRIFALLLMALTCLKVFPQCSSSIAFQNPSFEGTRNDTVPPPQWISCQNATTGPNAYTSVTAYAGNSYVVLEYNGAETIPVTGAVSQKLGDTLVLGRQYSISFALNNFDLNETTLGNVSFEIWGSYDACDFSNNATRLWLDGVTIPNFWQVNTASFWAPARYTYISFRIYVLQQTALQYYVGLDSISVGLSLNTTISDSNNIFVAATSFTPIAYQWYLNGASIPGATHENYPPSQNGNYYVIATSDSGCQSTSNTLSFTAASIPTLAASGISIYPNPASSAVTINAGSKPIAFGLYDITGREILSKEMNGTTILDISNFAKGLYLVKIQQGGNTYCQKLVIQ